MGFPLGTINWPENAANAIFHDILVSAVWAPPTTELHQIFASQHRPHIVTRRILYKYPLCTHLWWKSAKEGAPHASTCATALCSVPQKSSPELTARGSEPQSLFPIHLTRCDLSYRHFFLYPTPLPSTPWPLLEFTSFSKLVNDHKLQFTFLLCGNIQVKFCTELLNPDNEKMMPGLGVSGSPATSSFPRPPFLV